jgi:hypothetical protein
MDRTDAALLRGVCHAMHPSACSARMGLCHLASRGAGRYADLRGKHPQQNAESEHHASEWMCGHHADKSKASDSKIQRTAHPCMAMYGRWELSARRTVTVFGRRCLC